MKIMNETTGDVSIFGYNCRFLKYVQIFFFKIKYTDLSESMGGSKIASYRKRNAIISRLLIYQIAFFFLNRIKLL
jgi:hypothetical protein